MTDLQKIVKYLAIVLAVFLIVGIFMGILSVFSTLDIFSRSFSDHKNAMQDYPVSGSVSELEINIGAAELIIANGEQFSLSANLKDLKVDLSNGCLSIHESVQFGKNYNGSVIRLTVPKDHVFEKLSIFSGAGKLQVSTLSAQSLALNLGAGQAVFDSLTAEKNALISTGAGELKIEGGALSNLDLDMGVGKVFLKSRLSGESELNQGIGEAELILTGAKEDYQIHIDKGIGSAVIDGKQVSDDTTCGSGPSEVEIDGGVGSIRVSFS